MEDQVNEKGLLRYLHTAQVFIGDFCLVFLCLLTVFQVVLRYVFKAPLLGIEELMAFPIIWLYMIGGANASAEGSHIECGLFESGDKQKKSKRMLRFIKKLLSCAISVVLTYWSYSLFSYSLTTWKLSAILEIPTLFEEGVPFIGLLLMSIYEIRDLYKSAVALSERGGSHA